MFKHFQTFSSYPQVQQQQKQQSVSIPMSLPDASLPMTTISGAEIQSQHNFPLHHQNINHPQN